MSRYALCCSLFATVAFAGELKGVKMPDTVDVGGKALRLQGMGLRTKFVFKVYVAGLYLETPSSDAEQILASDTIRRVDLTMLRDIGKDKIVTGIHEGVERNSKDKIDVFKARLDAIAAAIPDLKEGQTLSITYEPGKGTTVKGPGGTEKTAEGKDFADAVFMGWLGKVPADEDLKKGMLGAK